MDQQKNYRALFTHHLDGELLENIRSNTSKGMAIGHNHFKEQITALTGRRPKPKKCGRPTGWRKAENEI
ncbi:MAG: hypothetical protein L3J26_11205 [Candidatus Polarisedimenticolaceae bacterium]|nr:hypothetical protein [Candidatus Polarisedimenticolaceae bacterium]